MKLNQILLADLKREAEGVRRVLERAPEGRPEWKPHPKSMPLGYLTNLVATMPSWILRMVADDAWDLNPPGGTPHRQPDLKTRSEWLEAHDKGVAEACHALENISEEKLMLPWRFMVGGNVVSEQPRHIMIRDGVLNHMAHHCGQLTVYLRLNSEPVPGIYGPSADETPGM
jgi:uncharacterized damage-inducible protein DinB